MYVHEYFPTRFKGLRVGVYECHLADGKPVMRNRDGRGDNFGPDPVAAAPATPCPGGVYRPLAGFFR